MNFSAVSNFNWDRFLAGEVGFNAESVESAEAFLVECMHRDIPCPKGCTYNTFRFMWYKHQDNTVYYLNNYLTFTDLNNKPAHIVEISIA